MDLISSYSAFRPFILFYRGVSVNRLAVLVKRGPIEVSKVRFIKTRLTELAEMQTEETMLQAEIEFWRYMIESRRGTVSAQATERMMYACELAERRLMMMDRVSSKTETMQ